MSENIKLNTLQFNAFYEMAILTLNVLNNV